MTHEASLRICIYPKWLMVGRRTWTGSWWLCAATSEAGPADGCCLRVCKGYVKAAHIQDNPQPSEARAVMPSTVHGRMACRNAVNGPILNSWSCSVQCGGCRVMVARTYFVNAPLCVRKRSDERCVASQGNRRVAAQASSTSAHCGSGCATAAHHRQLPRTAESRKASSRWRQPM